MADPQKRDWRTMSAVDLGREVEKMERGEETLLNLSKDEQSRIMNALHPERAMAEQISSLPKDQQWGAQQLLLGKSPEQQAVGGADAASSNASKAVDVFRDTPVRFMGYANELGEAFRFILPRLVAPSYAVAGLYCLADTYSKASEKPTAREMLVEGVDTGLWQTLASVAIPGFAINRVVALSRSALQGMSSLPPAAVRWGPTAAGLGIIPFIVGPIDHFVHRVMDNTLRPVLGRPAHLPSWGEDR